MRYFHSQNKEQNESKIYYSHSYTLRRGDFKITLFGFCFAPEKRKKPRHGKNDNNK